MNSETSFYVYTHIFPAAFALLPGKMNTPQGQAQMLAIGGQESQFEDRVQGRNGPAHGLWQFEKNGGVKEVLTSSITRPILLPILELLRYKPVVDDCYQAIVHNDVLALVFARLLMWKYPGALALEHQEQKAYHQYLAAWRPGKPGPERWPSNYRAAWSLVKGE